MRPALERSPRPSAVSSALWLAVAAIALGLINTLQMSSTVSAQVSPELLLATSLASTAFWALVIYSFATGRNWARIVFVVLALLGLPGMFLSLALLPDADRLTRALVLTQNGSNLVAAVLLLAPTSSRWFKVRAP